MKIKYYNILPSVVMMILIIMHNRGVSGGDILIQFSICDIYTGIISICFKNFYKI